MQIRAWILKYMNNYRECEERDTTVMCREQEMCVSMIGGSVLYVLRVGHGASVLCIVYGFLLGSTATHLNTFTCVCYRVACQALPLELCFLL